MGNIYNSCRLPLRMKLAGMLLMGSFSFASRMIEQYNSLMMLKGELTHCPV